MEFGLVSTCVAFLLGTLTGAAGMYYGELFTDQRRKKEKARAERQAFDTVCQQMPDLIKEMRDDLTKKPHVREFFLLREGSAFGINNADAFVYRFSEKRPVRSWVKTLENHGYVQDVTPEKTPKYCMTEEFVGLILKPR